MSDQGTWTLWDFIRASEHERPQKIREHFRSISSEDLSVLKKESQKVMESLDIEEARPDE